MPLLDADDDADDACDPGVDICGGPFTCDTVTMAPPPAPPPWLNSSAMDGDVADAIDVGSRHTELALSGPSPPPDGPISAIDGVNKGNEEAILKLFSVCFSVQLFQLSASASVGCTFGFGLLFIDLIFFSFYYFFF